VRASASGGPHDRWVSGAANSRTGLIIHATLRRGSRIATVDRKRGTYVLTVWGVIPKAFPVGRLGDDLAAYPVIRYRVELNEGLTALLTSAGWLSFFHEAATLQISIVSTR